MSVKDENNNLTSQLDLLIEKLGRNLPVKTMRFIDKILIELKV